VDSVTGYLKKEDNNLLSIDEVNGDLLFTVDIHTNKTNFSNAELRDRIEVFICELQCSAHGYRKTYSFYFDKSKYDTTIRKILLDEESVFYLADEKTYWVRNLFSETDEPFAEISSWDNNEGSYPKSQFDLDVLDDLFATTKLETEWLKISPSMEKFQARIENLITFG